MKIGISTATINLDQKIRKQKGSKLLVWDITFFDVSSTSFPNLLISLSKDKHVAKEMKKKLKESFKKIGIKNGSQVVVAFDRSTHDIIAIASSGQRLWFSVKDNFILTELKLNTSSVKVYYY